MAARGAGAPQQLKRENNMISRRDLTKGAIAATVLASSLTGATRSFAGLDFDKPSDMLTTLVKMRGSSKSELVIWYLKGTVFGVRNQQVRQLWGLHSVNFNHFQRQSDTEYTMTSVEFNYPYDLKTGAHLKEVMNPYTEEMITLGYSPFGPNTLLLTGEGFKLPPDREEFKSAKLETALGPVHIHDDDLWLFEDFYAEVPSMSGDGRPWYANDITTYKAKVSDLNDEAITSAPTTLSFQSVVSWQAWMNMGDITGHMMSRLAGKKLRSRDDLPEWFLTVAGQEHPETLRDAEKLIGLT